MSRAAELQEEALSRGLGGVAFEMLALVQSYGQEM